ncbi:MAG: glycine cleavage system aminomethyltransferase GcvT [Candidatus Latescibacterota bacterium]
MNQEELRRTPLDAVHRQEGARMVPFGGWEMPVQYRGIGEEHRAVRTGVGVFDVSHMGRLELEGPEVLAFLQHLLPADLARLAPGRMAYTVLCNDAGGVIDDLLVGRLGGERYLLVVNASRLAEDLAWLHRHLGSRKVSLVDRSPATGMLAVQGPGSEAALAPLVGDSVRRLAFYACCRARFEGKEVLVSRSGYTGEDGFEVICPADRLAALWQALRGAGAVACGLGARDTLRTEMGYCLYGHELDCDTTPLEAGLAWTLDLDKAEDFPGKRALLRQRDRGPDRTLVGLLAQERGIPRPGQGVLDGAGATVGRVTSGTFSPTLERGVALAYVLPTLARPGTALVVDVRGRPLPTYVGPLPFVPAQTRGRRRTPSRG